jgi:hypothetical protein
MQKKTMNGLRLAGNWIQRLLAVRIPHDTLCGLRRQ